MEEKKEEEVRKGKEGWKSVVASEGREGEEEEKKGERVVSK